LSENEVRVIQGSVTHAKIQFVLTLALTFKVLQ